jgi:restriction system protein
MISFPAAILLAFFTLLIGLAIGFAAGRQMLLRSSMGEALVANTISSHFARPHVLLNNVTLPTETGTTQIDHVLFADTGIFVIETKHYQGWIFGGSNQNEWTQVIFKKKSRFQNPIRQNYGHLKTLQSMFTLPEDNFIPVVVFTGDAEFKTDLGPSVVKLAAFMAFLGRERPVLFDERKMAYIVGRLEMKRSRRSLETEEYHINYVRGRLGRT